jgi:hypothetical protein
MSKDAHADDDLRPESDWEAGPSNVFVRAAADGDIETVRRMLGDGADINQRDRGFRGGENWTGRDPRDPNTFGATALEMAIRTKNLPMLKFLFEAGAEPNPYDESRKSRVSAVSLATAVGFLDGLRYLVDEQKMPLIPEDDTPAWMLVHAIGEKGSLGVLRYLIEEKGLDPRMKTENGVSAASSANAGYMKDPSFLEYLYSKGGVPQDTQHVNPKAKISFADGAKDDLESLSGQSFNAFEDMMEKMERYGSHSTLLNESVFNGDVDKVRVHLKYGANPLNPDDQGVDAYDVLQALRVQPEESFLRYRPEHNQILDMLNEAVARQAKPSPAAPKP